ncbi:uncharacterized protein FSUBG_10297 [Fusarium subglutinans]|uniref:DUF7587 domain-containing protein n=1 Tax=Gibberella subglutinans TaxID=42677 RepID=A0A8H5ULP7_GIBSU|nr:uncharacterized protein FSUBG_10297 [Fusarium subglutinans]KAF5591993.1 hypothetical protein FSUBG_10297 [Fusarium subglutinans]
MGTKYEDAVDSIITRIINALHIPDDGLVNLRSEVQDAISDFNQAVEFAQLSEARLVALLNFPFAIYQASEEELFKIRASVIRITKSIQNVTGASDRSLVEIITSRTGLRGRHVDRLLKHFRAAIDDIVLKTIDKIDERLECEWRIAEECYNQVRDPSGSLYPEPYFELTSDDLCPSYGSKGLEPSNMVNHIRGPYQNFTGEQRGELDEERKAEIRNQWTDFWIRALNKCHSGPTLFHPRSILSSAGDWLPSKYVPRYLFRVYDSKSSGLNSETVFASEYSILSYRYPESKVDLLSLDDTTASGMLFHHLERKNCFGSSGFQKGALRDNLVSWTSSLMNAIQYAIWRSHVGHTPTSDVRICAVDTRKFPRGQFARDALLLLSYAHPKSDWFRLKNREFDNGEYISQGTINHAGRSVVFSLEDLVAFGLYELYPEFAEHSSATTWTSRVLELRTSWSDRCQTYSEDFSLACEIAKGPMNGLDTWDAVLLLMAFRNRSLSRIWYSWELLMRLFPDPDETMNDHANTATAEFGSIASGIDALNITGKKRRQPAKSLKEVMHSYGEAVDALSKHATNIVELLRTDGIFNTEDVESICTVPTRAIELVRVAKLLNDSAIQAIVRQVVSFGDKAYFNVSALLEHFKKPIERIAQGIIREAQNDDILWKTAEECYHQATRPSGDLNLEDYLATINPLLWKEEKKEDWIKFWLQSLCNCPGGPTLFQPEEDIVFDHSAKRPPRYLFRTYDVNSTGRNDTDCIASIISQDDEANRHRINIFSTDYQEASEMLHRHLGKGLSSTWETDNLVSWSSSLLFVIQYANWRFCNPWFSQPGDICICAVDTSRFPRGQFARDKWLLNSFKDAEFSDQESSFRDLRFNQSEYDNGEYLSQGVLHIEKRSCTLSLRDLKNAGLWDLYPKFNVNDVQRDADVRTQWTDYVKALRWEWQVTKKTTKADVQCALDIAQKCFPDFDEDDMALLLLSFHERKLRPETLSF